MALIARLLSKLNIFVVTNVTLVVLGFVFILFLDYQTKKSVISEFEEEVHLELEQRASELQLYMESSRNAVDFLHATPPINAIVRSLQNGGLDPIDQTPVDAWYARIETIFEAYLENKQHINQARIIRFDEAGQELVRVQQSKGKVRVVQRTRLQQKAGRDYYAQAQNLSPDEVYFSTISLNREWGKLEYPYWPTYRVMRNIYDDHNRAFGFLIININPEDLLTTLASNLDEKYQFYLVNAEGGAIIHPNSEAAFAFEFDENEKWTDEVINQGEGFFKSFSHVSSQSNPIYFKQKELIVSPVDNNVFRLIIGFNSDVFKAEVNARRTFTMLIVLSLISLFMLVSVSWHRSYRRQAELSRKEAEYQAIFDGSNDAVISMDKDGRITNWNRAASSMFGYPRNAAIGKVVFDLILHHETSRFSGDLLMKVFEGESVKPTDICAKNIRGERLDVSITLSPIVSGDDGLVEGAACILRDVTEQKIVEKQILQLNTSLEKQVQERTAELVQARNEALEVSKVKSEFVASVSHEIRTPMNGVIGMLHMLAKTPLNDLQSKYLTMAHNSAKALTSLINDILDLSKIEADKLELDEQKFDVFELFGEACSSLALAAQDKGLKFILDTSGVDRSYLISDDNRLRQVLINLVSNATKFTSQGSVKVRVYSKDIDARQCFLFFEVIDTGVGIAKDKQSKLFESFSQEDSSTSRKYGGTGLGLAICKKLAELLGGEIAIESETGKGSKFTFFAKTQIASEKHTLLPLTETLSKTNIVSVVNELENREAVHNALQGVTSSYITLENLDALDDLNSVGDEDSSEFIVITDSKDEYVAKSKNSKEVKILRLVDGVGVNSKAGSWVLSNLFTSRDLLARLCEMQGVAVELLGLYSESNFQHNKELEVIIEQYADSAILLVDDNEINLEVARGMLLEYGLKADTACDGEQAIQKLKNKEYQLVLMDCQMPIVDGFETTRRIRKGESGESAAAIPIIAMTANAMSGSKEDCLASGMNDYITKPLDPEELEEKLAYWLQFESQLNKQLTARKGAASSSLESTEIKGNSSDDDKTKEFVKWDDEPIWNLEDALKRVRYKHNRLETLITMFLEHTPSRLDELRALARSNAWSDMAKIAHEVKGVSGNISAQRLYLISSELEEACKSQDAQTVQLLLPTLIPSWLEVESLMRDYLQKKASNVGPG